MLYPDPQLNPDYLHKTENLSIESPRMRVIARLPRKPAFAPFLPSLPQLNRYRLWYLSIALCCLTALLCVAVITVSRGTGVSNHILDTDIRDCGQVPCFRGLMPGQTSWFDALAAYHGQWHIIHDPDYAGIILSPSPDGRNLGSIILNLRPRPDVTLGTILTRYGTPTCIGIILRTGMMSLYYPQLRVLTRFSGNRLDAFAKVISITLSPDQTSSFCSASFSITGREAISHHNWQGFATLTHYLDSVAQ